jgi:hypothetical protein
MKTVNQLDVIYSNVSNADYPGKFTNFEINIIKFYMRGFTLHLFSGTSDIGDIRIDFSRKEATHNMDVFKFLAKNIDKLIGKVKTIILDAPYNKKFADEYNSVCNINENQFIIFANSPKTTELFDYIRKIRPQIIIIKSWNWYLFKHYSLEKGYLIYHGGYQRDTKLLIQTMNPNFRFIKTQNLREL